MNCLSLEHIYLYLEQELLSSERKEIELHIAQCPKCKKTLEERKLLLQAAESLPSLEVPADFAEQTMRKLFPVKVTTKGWLAAFAVGFSAFLLSSLMYLLVTGQSFTSLFTSFFYSLLEQGKNVSALFIKLYKLGSFIISIIPSILNQLMETFRKLTTVISPEVQVIIIFTNLILAFSLIYGLRRIFSFGEKQ